MGFPVVYTDLFLPKFLLYFLTFLGFIRKFCNTIFSVFGLGEFSDPETGSFTAWKNQSSGSVSAALIREMLPVVKFSDLGEMDTTENCAVCLYDFNCDDEIRRLANCRHIFHRSCVDRWMDHDQKTCPMCRTQFIPEDMQEAFNERLYSDYSLITTVL